jgi:hypothetical protein
VAASDDVGPIVTNAADAERTALALTTFHNLLAADARVIEACTRWRAARGLARPKRRLTAAKARLVGAAILREDPADAALLRALVAELGLSYSWPSPWPSLLLAQFRVVAIGEASGQPYSLRFGPHRRPTTATVAPGETAAAFARRMRALSAATWPKAGRRAISKQEALVRDVQWYYRAKIKQPRDTIASIAREYAEAAGHRTNARSFVQYGIAHAQKFIDLNCLPPPA